MCWTARARCHSGELCLYADDNFLFSWFSPRKALTGYHFRFHNYSWHELCVFALSMDIQCAFDPFTSPLVIEFLFMHF